MILLENSLISVEVDPAHGGRIDSIRASADGEDWIYNSGPATGQSEAAQPEYDDVWTGGFEELFPNDAPCHFEGRTLPDHGELWTSELSIDALDGRSVDMSLQCRTVPARFSKRISVDRHATSVSIEYGISNEGEEPLDYLFKLHAAMRVAAGDQLLLPGGEVTRVSEDFSRLMGHSDGSAWPVVGGLDGEPVDLSAICARDPKAQEFVYVTGLPAGWCGLRRSSSDKRFVIRYDLNDFPYCWLFMALGGWRDHYTVVLEPCTNIPKDLEAAKQAGTCARLQPGASRSYSVSIDIS